MNTLRGASKSGPSLSPDRELARVNPSMFATLARTVRQVLPRLGGVKPVHSSAQADEETVMHSPFL
jgi:hypothetical protein